MALSEKRLSNSRGLNHHFPFFTIEWLFRGYTGRPHGHSYISEALGRFFSAAIARLTSGLGWCRTFTFPDIQWSWEIATWIQSNPRNRKKLSQIVHLVLQQCMPHSDESHINRAALNNFTWRLVSISEHFLRVCFLLNPSKIAGESSFCW